MAPRGAKVGNRVSAQVGHLNGAAAFVHRVLPVVRDDLRDYDRLFEESWACFVKLLAERPVTWTGTVRAPLHDADVFPKTDSGRLTTGWAWAARGVRGGAAGGGGRVDQVGGRAPIPPLG